MTSPDRPRRGGVMGQDDPAVVAAAEALWRDADYDGDDTWANGDPMPEEHLYRAEVVVAAYRRHVLAHRPDAERVDKVGTFLALLEKSGTEEYVDYRQDVRLLLAALADAAARAEAAEAETVRLGRDHAEQLRNRIALETLAVDGGDLGEAWMAVPEDCLYALADSWEA